LLRVLEERVVERLGSNRPRRIDIRLIVATNEDLAVKVRRGEFREDLFFRVNVFPIRLPPLRERLEDIALLADHFLRRTCQEHGIPIKRFTPEAREALLSGEWRGNVRELLNVVETAALMADGGAVGPDHLPMRTEPRGDPVLSSAEKGGFKQAVSDFERRLLLEAITRAGGNKAKAARELGLDPGQMKYLVKKYDL
ncbi:MAG: hypothetical protein DMF49_02815, partial [Acidobacteria bacterium]